MVDNARVSENTDAAPGAEESRPPAGGTRESYTDSVDPSAANEAQIVADIQDENDELARDRAGAARRGRVVRGDTLSRLAEYRRRQREALRASNSPGSIARSAQGRIAEGEKPSATEQVPLGAIVGESGDESARLVDDPAEHRTSGEIAAENLGKPLGVAGATRVMSMRQPATAKKGLLGHSPMSLGFWVTVGGLLAYVLYQNITQLGTVLTILLVAFFLTLSLNPIVELLTRRGIKRGWAVTIVGLGLLAAFGILLWIVLPPLVAQTTTLIDKAPQYARDVTESEWWKRWDAKWGLGEKITDAVNSKVSDGALAERAVGGVLGAGQMVAQWLFVAVTIMVLTLYFLGSLPAIKRVAYAAVPASKRPRFIALAEEIMSRVGLYAMGQVLVATLNGLQTWVVLSLLGLPYPAVLAVTVGFFGLVPLVGATIGGAIIVAVAAFHSWQMALIVLIYYNLYQQIENYVIFPNVMKRTVSVPAAVTMVAALIGGTLLGVMGALMAIPVAAGIILIFNEVVVPRQDAI